MCMDTTNLTGMTPAEIDTAWGIINAEIAKANHVIEQAKKTIIRYDGDSFSIYQGYADAAKAKLEAAEFDKAVALESLAPFMAEWSKRGGWNRAYLCAANGGHIHKHTCCSTLHVTTLISFLPEQSGLSEDEIVALAGVQACTVCYPSAPVDALKAALAAEKAKTECPGSRTHDHDSSGLRFHSRRAKCNHCEQTISVTSTNMLRAHKPPKAS